MGAEDTVDRGRTSGRPQVPTDRIWPSSVVTEGLWAVDKVCSTGGGTPGAVAAPGHQGEVSWAWELWG